MNGLPTTQTRLGGSKTSHALSLELITAIVKRAEQSAVRRDLGGYPAPEACAFQ